MKKFLLFTAICAIITACSNDLNNSSLVAGEQVTLKATVNINNQISTKVAPDDPSAATVTFHWEQGDKVTISNASGSEVFSVTKINGDEAELTGRALADMSSYTATYNAYTNSVVPYISGSFKPVVSGTGVESVITMNNFKPVLSLSLTGVDGNGDPISIDSISYYVNAQRSTALAFDGGIDLGTAAKTIYFPVLDDAAAGMAKINFWSDDVQLLSKSIASEVSNGNVVTYPNIELTIMVGEITLNKDSEGDQFTIGSNYQLTINSILPANANNKNVTWSSNNESLATVDANGLVTFQATFESSDEVVITCASTDGSGVSATCRFYRSSCLAAGTRITMADGSYKNVEDIVEGDMVRTFNHETGMISSSNICLAMQEEGQVKPLTLSFASGAALTIAGQHGMLEKSSLKYKLINKVNVEKYVGKYFYNAESGSWDQLVSYEIGNTCVNRYAIYSANHLNFIAESMLTVEDDVDFLLNIYELDENLKADAAQLAADVANYGLFDVTAEYPEYASFKNQMEDLQSEYVYIAIGKGLVPTNYIETVMPFWTE